MPRVHYVKAARKDNPVAKAGEPYYWWKNNWGPKRYSKTMPKPSQTTGSEFIAEYLAIGEDLETALQDAVTGDDLQSAVDEAKDRITTLRDETQEKLDNMPDALQTSPTGELLQERIDALEEWENALDGVDTDVPEPEDIDPKDDMADTVEELMEERRQEILEADPGLPG